MKVNLGPPGWPSLEMMIRTLVLGLFLVGSTSALDSAWLPNDSYGTDEAAAQQFASDYNHTAEQVLYLSVEASWTYNTNLTDYNSAKQVEAAGIEQEFNYVWGKKAKELFLNTYGNFTDLELKKVIESIWTLGVANLVESERNQVSATPSSPTHDICKANIF
ncbi:unnamed protein product [Ranitomeya imitator]|uniref:Uncharacterized protein n=1 Tax=Ranitomeya imitator TaxID=111125 RepID=A0ABN9L545_9NEOB|nr:unnamed protein product [Ranitomeya imitator]